MSELPGRSEKPARAQVPPDVNVGADIASPPQRVTVVFNEPSGGDRVNTGNKPEVRRLLAQHEVAADVAGRLPVDPEAARRDPKEEYRERLGRADSLVDGEIERAVGQDAPEGKSADRGLFDPAIKPRELGRPHIPVEVTEEEA